MKTYELLAIVKPNIDSEDVDNIISKIDSLITSMNGKVENVDKMGRRKLSYDIQNFRDGYFVSILLQLPAEKILEFKRQLKLNESLLRTMFMDAAKVGV